MTKIKFNFLLTLIFLLLLPLFLRCGFSHIISPEEYQRLQSGLGEKTTGEKIAFWAERFVGTPYDRDPKGEYVTRAAIVADEKVDCMYLTFRAAELALSRTPEEAIQIALDKRFHSRGMVRDGKVINYEDRFQYGEDMIRSGKWAREITSELGRTTRIQGVRSYEFFEILPKSEILRSADHLQSGDIIFFLKAPEKRIVEEGVGHIGIIKIEGEAPTKKIFLIHASGSKSKGGSVKKILLQDYVSKMVFIGVKVTRFD